MFKILTTDGVFLDLNEDWETEIEIENPIFSTDSVPVAFSTSVLLPTHLKSSGNVCISARSPVVRAWRSSDTGQASFG